jgi:hypothetical protein
MARSLLTMRKPMPGSLGSCGLLLLAVFAIAGCGGDIVLPPPSVENVGNTIAFIPDHVDVARISPACGVSNPPFMNGDLFGMNVVGDNGGDGCPEG